MSLSRSLILMGLSYFLPRAISFYNAFGSSSARNRDPKRGQNKFAEIYSETGVRACPPATTRALNILFFSAFVFFLFTFPQLTTPNVFVETGSDIRTATPVLFSQLASIRPLTKLDEQVRRAFQASRESRFLYAVYGPDVLTECTICGGNLAISDPDAVIGTGTAFGPRYDGMGALNSFFLYAFPRLVIPHAIHLALIGFATSSTIGGFHAFAWRRFALSTGLLFGAAEILLIANVVPANMTKMQWSPNTSSALFDTFFIHWSSRLVRFLSFVLFDLFLAWAIWLWATNRWPGQKPDPILQLVEAEELMRASIISVSRAQRTGEIFGVGGNSSVGASTRSSSKDGIKRRWQDEDPRVLEELDLVGVRMEAEKTASEVLQSYFDSVRQQQQEQSVAGKPKGAAESVPNVTVQL